MTALLCIECIKADKYIEARAVYLGKSLCAEHIPPALVAGKEMVAMGEELKVLMTETSVALSQTSGRMSKLMDDLERGRGN